MTLGVTMTSSDHLASAEKLAGRHPFLVRVPLVWTDDAEVQGDRIQLVRAASHRGWRVIVNLRYRTVPEDMVTDPLGGFRAWVDSTVRSLAALPDVGFEISNRPNAPVPQGDPEALDPAAEKALVEGVIAAADAVPGSTVGFSWLATGIPAYDDAWWAKLESIGGRTLPGRVSFVSVQMFPGSQGPSQPWALSEYGYGPRRQVEDMLRDTRRRHMPVLGLDDEVAIVVGEFGAPVSPGDDIPYATDDPDVHQALATRSSQARALEAMAEAIWSTSSAWNVQGAAWTALADPSEGCELERCWGLMTSSGSERPAFDELLYQVSRASL
jgi:hypothetical protein